VNTTPPRDADLRIRALTQAYLNARRPFGDGATLTPLRAADCLERAGVTRLWVKGETTATTAGWMTLKAVGRRKRPVYPSRSRQRTGQRLFFFLSSFFLFFLLFPALS